MNVVAISDEWEEVFHWPEVKKNFPLAHWRQNHIPFVITIRAFQKSLQLTVFNIEKETAKSYPELSLTGQLEEDRRQLHKIADAVHRDLSGSKGVASLRLIYSQRMKDLANSRWVSEIWTSDYDGYNAQQMTFENDYCVSPSFFAHTVGEPNPSFFYVSYKQGQSKIYRFSQGKNELAFELRGNQVLPTMNAKGSQMAFISDVAGRPDLFLQNFDSLGKPIGKSRQLFSSPRATQASPTFSPKGDKLAFVSDKDGSPRLYVLDILSAKDTKRIHPKMITKRNRENTCPSWSPDGKKLVYSAKEEGVRQIWIYDFETDSEMPLTKGPEHKENPMWAPDSLHLVYNTEHEEEGQLFLINLRQKDPIPITKGEGQKRFASWESRDIEW
jgi:TolB protein